VKRTDIAGEQINNEGLTGHLYGNDVAVSTGIYRGKGMPSGKPFSRRFTNVWLNQNGRWECIASQSTLITH
jgi:ketosteroid isomerase-like protein